MIILGLDVSTSVVGVAIMDSGSELIYFESCDLKKYKDFFDKCEEFKKFIDPILKRYNPQSIWIEKPLQAFSKGLSSATTISKLSSFNGAVSYLTFELTGLKPKYVAPSSARKKAGITIKRGMKSKEVVLEHICKNYSHFKPEYTKFGNVKKQYYDMADAIVVAKAGLVEEEYGKEREDTS
jgi:Holliday junction resolvasome RuvABC endonuclease subunit